MTIQQLKTFRNQHLAEEKDLEKEQNHLIKNSISNFTSLAADRVYQKTLDLVGEEIMKRGITDHLIIDTTYDEIMSKVKARLKR